MSISYGSIYGAFLAKITEYELVEMSDAAREELVLGYLKRAIVAFAPICKYKIASAMDDEQEIIDIDVSDVEADEIIEIVSEGMLVQWMKPYVYRQENLENVLNTRDFTSYSPAELLMRVGNAYTKAQKDYTNMIREYSYVHADLRKLHL